MFVYRLRDLLPGPRLQLLHREGADLLQRRHRRLDRRRRHRLRRCRRRHRRRHLARRLPQEEVWQRR